MTPLLLACSDDGGGAAPSLPLDSGAPTADAAPDDRVTESGKVVDYDTEHPLEGFTVTDSDQVATTDASGLWSLTMPKGATLAPMVTGTDYTQLFLPQATATSSFDRGKIVIPRRDTFHFAQGALGNDTSLAVVYVVVETLASCASAAGGTLTVLSPEGTTVRYFSSGGLPIVTADRFADLEARKPVAVVYNVPPGEELVVAVEHPTCKQVPYPAMIDGALFTGRVTTRASADGDSNSALHVVLE